MRRDGVQMFAASPVAGDMESRHLVVAVLVATTAIGILLAVVHTDRRALMLAFACVQAACLLFALRGILLPARIAAPLAGLVVFGVLIFRDYGLHDLAILGLPVVIVGAGLVTGRWGTLAYGVACVFLLAALGLREAAAGAAGPPHLLNRLVDYGVAALGIALVAVLQWLVMGRLNENIRRARRSEAEQRAASERLREATAAREALIVELAAKNTELERFTYTVSHDLKAPLITIQSFAGYLAEDAADGDAARLAADVARIIQAGDRMRRLLDDLLELSRIGRIANPHADVAFADIAREAVEAVDGRIRERGVAVRIADALPVVRGDRTRLVEVVQNLLDNAVKFMGGQEHPVVEIGANAAEEAGRATLFVRDNGIGIEPQLAERVFGLFAKLDPASEGTGIGLALVRRIVEVHGGKIWVESGGQSSGSTFLFTLPLAAAGGTP
jgi:signal transduction histidine kinase